MKRSQLLCVALFALGGSIRLAQAAPALLIDSHTATQVRLAWSNAPGNFVLEVTTNAFTSPSLWLPFQQTPTLSNGISLVVVDLAGVSRFFRLHAIQSGGLPPDPATVAPPPPDGVATLIGESTSFLYTGANPIQTGVSNGAVEPKRAAVIRGKVQLRDGSPLSSVAISILNHPEFGQTLSRANGMFD
jgi:hypothetical protein